MLPDGFDQLRDRFPAIFTGGVDLGPGWYDLLWAYGEMIDEAGAYAHVTYAKEKCGALSLFVITDGALDDLDYHAETLSVWICDECGAPGANRADRGWFQTCCNFHDAERRS